MVAAASAQQFHSTAGRGHIAVGFYKVASAGGPSVFRPLCWGPVVRVPRGRIVLGAWVPRTRTSFLTLVKITSKPCLCHPIFIMAFLVLEKFINSWSTMKLIKVITLITHFRKSLEFFLIG